MNYSNEYCKFYFQEWQLSLDEAKKIEIVAISVATVGALLNSVVIVAMAIDPLKILRKGPWVNILNLAIADLISCITAFCMWARKFYIQEIDRKLYDAISAFGCGFGFSASFLFLTFLTVQIFLITKFPIKTRYWFTTLKIVSVGIVIWLFAFALGLTHITRQFSHFSGIVNFRFLVAGLGVKLIALVVLFILNILVIVEIIRSGRSTGNAENTKHRKIAKTVVILTLILFTTAFPFFVLRQMTLLSILGYFDQGKNSGIIYYLFYYYGPIAMVNFAANPILYALRLPNYRQTLLVFIGKRKSKTGYRKRLMQNISPNSTNAFPLQRQRALVTSPERQKFSLERLPMPV